MESRNLPDVVEATFGVGLPMGVKLLTSNRLLQKKHSLCWPISTRATGLARTHSILRFALQNYYFKSRIPDPDLRLSGDLGQP
jgi:hypothetical protein